MDYLKRQAVEALNELHRTIPYETYSVIHDGLTDIELLRDRDEELEELWDEFEDIAVNPETECIEEPFLGWGVGIHREEIWHWFDKRHSKGVHYLLYGETKPDKITLKNAVEVPVWAVVAATEPNRAIEVQMTYADLLAIVNWVTSTVGGKENGNGKN